MAFSRKAITAGAVGVAALALIGTGAGASFTDAVHATQTIHAGTMNVQILRNGAGTVSTDGKSVTLPAFGPTGSTFEKNTVITVKNYGEIPATFHSFQMTESHDANNNANNTLFAETNVCIQSTDSVSAGGASWIEGNGPLATAVALNPSVKENPVVLQPNDTMTFSVDFYAGKDSVCGTTTSDGPSTTAAWVGYSGPYRTPASLTDDAQGGTITPTLTFTLDG